MNVLPTVVRLVVVRGLFFTLILSLFFNFESAAVQSAGALKLSESQIFHRCYSQMTRMYLLPDDPRLIQLEKGKATGADLCSRLLSDAQLDKNLLVKAGATRLEENKAILKTFHTLHVSWFHSYNYILDFNELLTSLLYDFSEMGTPFTMALLAPGTEFKSVLVNDKSFSAVRGRPHLTYTLDHHEKGDYFRIKHERPWRVGGKQGVYYKPEFVEFGELKGFAETGPPMFAEDSFKEKTFRVAVGAGLGTGGILGSTPYLILNSGFDRGKAPDDALYTHRSWSKAVFKDLLCRDLPLLTEDDVRQDVISGVKFEFQKNTKCLTCHSSIDTMAKTIRDKIILELHDAKEGPQPNRALHVGSIENQNRGAGSVKFRSFSGELINRNVENISELAKTLTATDDFYVCTAKRYFEFFTGISVPLVTAAPFSERMKDRYFDFVVSEGRKLKKHQNSSQLIRNILNSPFYAQKDYGLSNE